MADQTGTYLSLGRLAESWGCEDAWRISRIISDWLRVVDYRKSGKATQAAIEMGLGKHTVKGWAWNRELIAGYFPGYAHQRPGTEHLKAIRIATKFARINDIWEQNNEYPTNQMTQDWQETIREATKLGADWRRVTAHLCYQRASFVIIDDRWELEFIERKRNNSAA